VSQEESELAVKLVCVVVLLLTVRVWAAGVVPPIVLAKDIVVAERLNVGSGGLTVKVTVTVAGEPTAPGAVMVI
jgi:hypothetical protein